MTSVAGNPAPSGTVTFLFTDVEGSTRRWEQNRAAMEAALALHDRTVRASLEAHGGYVFKTVGDAFCAAFARPEAAAAAALDAQHALAATDFSAVDGLHVRMAAHTGTADERDGDYFGPAVNRVARLISLAHGGQILFSAVAADLSRDALPQGAEFVELGRHPLKDLTGDEHVHQLVDARLRSSFPALRTHRPPSAPWLVPEAMRTRYFTGREELLALIERQLAERGRVALAGLGGAGKTQSALEFATRRRTHYTGGVFWVNAETPAGLVAGFVEIAGALQLAGSDAGDQSQALRSAREWFARNDDWLLILDNVEERRDVLPYVPERGRGHVLITSRETVFQELGIPRALDVRDLDGDEAVAFLLARTGREDCGPAESASAAELAAEFGNLPLALEQAAAYIAETGAAFADYLQAFRKRRVALLERAEGLISRDTVAVTWRANFTAVESVSRASADALRIAAFLAPDAIPFEIFESASDADALSTAELLRPLARYSLIRADAIARVFGVHRLVQEIVRDALGERDSAAILDRAVEVVDAVFQYSFFEHWPSCERLLPHASSLLSWTERFGTETARLASLLLKVARYSSQRARYAESLAICARARQMAEKTVGTDDELYAAILLVEGTNRNRQGRFALCEPLYLQALRIRENKLGARDHRVAEVLLNLANAYIELARYDDARSNYERAIEIVREDVGEYHELMGTALNNLARVHQRTGRYDQVRPLDERALAIRERIFGPDHPHVALSLNMLAEDEARRGNFESAQGLLERSLDIRERAFGPYHDEVAECLTGLGAVRLRQGGYAGARSLYERAAAITERVSGSDHPDLSIALRGLAYAHLYEGREDEAEQLFERALAIHEKALGPDHVELAPSILGMAELHEHRGRRAEALPHLERPLAIKRRSHGDEHPEVQAIRERIRALAGA